RRHNRTRLENHTARPERELQRTERCMTNIFGGKLRSVASCAALFAITSLSGCQATDIPPDWKTDCVGRMQLSFPSDVEVAANTANMLEREYSIGSIQPRFDFADGQHASWSGLRYLGK